MLNNKVLPVDYSKPEKIKETTQMSSWFGKDRTGKEVMVDQEILIDLLEQYFKSKDLLNHCKKYDWVVLPDDTRLVCSLSGATEKGWIDIYTTLSKVIENHNSKIDLEIP